LDLVVWFGGSEGLAGSGAGHWG